MTETPATQPTDPVVDEIVRLRAEVDVDDEWVKSFEHFTPAASRRVWTHRRDNWLPNWAQCWGWPHFGGDEWGRRVITIGFWFVGYVSWAYRTCWCLDCHVIREQTYRWFGESIRRVGWERP